MPNDALIFQQIPKILADVEAIGKTRKNQQQGFMYRGVDDVLNALSPLFAKHQVFVTTQVTDEKREERTSKNGATLFYVRLTCEFTLYATDGSSVMCRMVGEAMDSGDKATSKAASVAYRNAMFQLFCIPTEEPDADEIAHEVAPADAEADAKYIANAHEEIAAATSVEELSLIGDMIRQKSDYVREKLRGLFVDRMKVLRMEAEENKSLEVAAAAAK